MTLKIFSDLETLEFAVLLTKPDAEVDAAIDSIFQTCQTHQKRIFNYQMCAMRVAYERKTWTRVIDHEYGVAFADPWRWIEVTYPDTYRYSHDALETALGLPEATLEDLGTMKRCNAVLLAAPSISDHVKRDPKVIEAAKTLSESKFRERLNQEGQHIEKPEIMRLCFEPTDAAIVRHALNLVAQKYQITLGKKLETLESRLIAWAEDYCYENDTDEVTARTA